MNHAELANALAREVLLKDREKQVNSQISLDSLNKYFLRMSMEELLGVATVNGIYTIY